MSTKVDILENFSTLNNMQSVSSNAVSKALSYSTTEQLTGGTWIDGKPIYKKTIVVTTGISATTHIYHGIDNLDTFISVVGLMYRTNGFVNPMVNNYTNWESYFYDYTTTRFTFKPSQNQLDAGIEKLIVNVEYTKTTD